MEFTALVNFEDIANFCLLSMERSSFGALNEAGLLQMMLFPLNMRLEKSPTDPLNLPRIEPFIVAIVFSPFIIF
jgi:hypothetical protein